MKIWISLIISMLLIIPSLSTAEDFLGAPIIPNSETVESTKKRIEISSKLSHDDVLKYYRNELRELTDIKFRDWKDATYIEDDGKLRWHSITISKGGTQGTIITIAKDSWTWIIGTLILRYIGVFVVLLILFLGMSISGNIISRTIKKIDSKKAG